MMRWLDTLRGKILIDEARPTDAVPFRELRLEALQDRPVAFSSDHQLNLSRPPKYWEEMLNMHPDESTLFLAKYQDDLIGMTGVYRGGSPKTRHGATIWGVYVTPKWRGLHIAEELIQSCLTWAKDRRIVIAKALRRQTPLRSAVTSAAALRSMAPNRVAYFMRGDITIFYWMSRFLDEK